MAAHVRIGDLQHTDGGLALGAALVRWTLRACALVMLIAAMWVVYRIVDGAEARGSASSQALDARPAALLRLATLEGEILSARVNGSARLTALTAGYVREIRAVEPAIGRIEARARLAAEAKVVARVCPTCAKTLRAVRFSLG